MRDASWVGLVGVFGAVGWGEMVLVEVSRALNPNGNAPINHKRETMMLGRAKKW